MSPLGWGIAPAPVGSRGWERKLAEVEIYLGFPSLMNVSFGSLADINASDEKGPLSGVKRKLSLRTSATHPNAVGRPLILAEKGLEMRPVGAFPCPDGTGKITPQPAPPFPYIFRTTVMARRRAHVKPLKRFGVPNGIRTRVATLKEWSPRPLDDGDGGGLCGIRPVP